MRADFFVHPDFVRHTPEHPITREYAEYEAKITEIFIESALPARIRSLREDPSKDPFWDRLRRNHPIFTSGQLVADGRTFDNGVIIDLDEIARLKELIFNEGITDVVVHGSYLGMCVKGFVTQLSSMRIVKRSIQLGSVLQHDIEENFPNSNSAIKARKDLAEFYGDETRIFSMGLDSFGKPRLAP